MGVQGLFSQSKYQASDGTFIYPIKLQPETISATFGGVANVEPAAAVTQFLPSAKATGSKNSIGMHPRTATVKITATGVVAANALGSLVRIPILTKTTAWKKGDVGVYQGDTAVVVRLSPEAVV